MVPPSCSRKIFPFRWKDPSAEADTYHHQSDSQFSRHLPKLPLLFTKFDDPLLRPEPLFPTGIGDKRAMSAMLRRDETNCRISFGSSRQKQHIWDEGIILGRNHQRRHPYLI